MFNLICELPETVARTLVPRMRVVKGSGKAINYLTPPRILLALVTAWVRRGRWFDEEVCFFSMQLVLFSFTFYFSNASIWNMLNSCRSHACKHDCCFHYYASCMHFSWYWTSRLLSYYASEIVKYTFLEKEYQALLPLHQMYMKLIVEYKEQWT